MLPSFRRALRRTFSVRDPWERFPIAVPTERYGLGACRDFTWYFEGESLVRVTSLEEMQDWILGCEYVRDRELFNEADVWQHPRSFEGLRKGDCEDFALWAWCTLVRLGYEAEFVAGRCVEPGAPPAPHAWIVVRKADGLHVFDPILRPRPLMVRPLDQVRGEYIPEVSIDGRFDRYAYAGYLWTAEEQEA